MSKLTRRSCAIAVSTTQAKPRPTANARHRQKLRSRTTLRPNKRPRRNCQILTTDANPPLLHWHVKVAGVVNSGTLMQIRKFCRPPAPPVFLLAPPQGGRRRPASVSRPRNLCIACREPGDVEAPGEARRVMTGFSLSLSGIRARSAAERCLDIPKLTLKPATRRSNRIILNYLFRV
jgi:hypothetical protein